MDAKRSHRSATAPGLAAVGDALLAWYDRDARDLPWRAPPGTAADPYHVWLSEVMLQQTTVAAVRPRFVAWIARWPTVAALAAADEAAVMAAWAGLGYYARARNLLATARAVAAAGGFPEEEAGLRALPGLGDYTAAAVAAIAFGRRAVVIDTNVARVVARLHAIAEPGRTPALRAAADAITPAARAGDFAQAMMDLGATICTPRAPRCPACPLADRCAALALGTPEAFPLRPPRRARPQRQGTIFWLEHPGRAHVLLVRRPAKGLLGGMRALPTGGWEAAAPGLDGAPAVADWRLLTRGVRHGFTHFTLELALAVAVAGAHAARGWPIADAAVADAGAGSGAAGWWPIERLAEAGLPTVFAAAARAIMEERGCDGSEPSGG